MTIRGRRHDEEDDPRLEAIIRASRSVSARLESVTSRLEEAVDRLAHEIETTEQRPGDL